MTQIEEKAVAMHKEGFTNKEIAENLGFKSIGHISNMLIRLGFRKQETRRFCEFEANFVKENYKSMGDKELSQKLTEMGYPRTLKMVEKFRTYKNLKRTEQELKAIRKGHYEKGVWSMEYTRTPEAQMKKSATLKAIWKREKWRMINGLSPITKFANRRIGNRRLSSKQILEIRALKKGKLSEYARKNNMTVSNVSLIHRQKSYRDISTNETIVRMPEKGTQIQYKNNSLNV